MEASPPSARLSRELYTTPSNITVIVDRLAAKGLLERVPQPGDRRVYLLNLTDSGRTLGKKLPDPIEKRLVSELTKSDTKQVAELGLALENLIRMVDDTPLV